MGLIVPCAFSSASSVARLGRRSRAHSERAFECLTPSVSDTSSDPADGRTLDCASAPCAAGLAHLAPAGEGSTEGDLVCVLEVAADGETAREARDSDAVAQAVGEVRRRRLARHRRVRGEHDLADAVRVDAAEELVDPQVAGLDAVDRAERAGEHVVELAVLVRALERDDVDRLLDDADRRLVAARVEADRARLVLGQIAALAAEADALLHLGDRRRERERLGARPLQDVERKPLRSSLPDAGQARQLGDEVLDGGAEHAAIVPGSPGCSGRASSAAHATTSANAVTRSAPAVPPGSRSWKSAIPATIGSAFVNSVERPAVVSAPPRWKPSWRQTNASPCAASSAATKTTRTPPPIAVFVATSPAA